MKILAINGPILLKAGNDGRPYGKDFLSAIEDRMEERAQEYNWEIDFERTHSEGDIVSLLLMANGNYDAVILNAGAYSHYSYVIRDAIASLSIPVVEVHPENIFSSESFRSVSVLAPVCRGTITGFGAASYVLAMEALIEIIE